MGCLTSSQLDDPDLKDFLQTPKCLSYFLNLFDFLVQETLRLSSRLPPLEDLRGMTMREVSNVRGNIEDSTGEVIDQLFFLNDLMSQKLPSALARLLVQSFLDSFIYPILVSGIMPPKSDAPELPTTTRLAVEKQEKPAPPPDVNDEWDLIDDTTVLPSSPPPGLSRLPPFPGIRLKSMDGTVIRSELKPISLPSSSTTDSGQKNDVPEEGEKERTEREEQERREEERRRKEEEEEEKKRKVYEERLRRQQKNQEEEIQMREQNRKEQAKLLDMAGETLKPAPQPQEGSPMYTQVMSVFLLMNVAHIYTHKPLINMLATSILHPSPPPQLCFLRPKSYKDAKTTASHSLILSKHDVRRPRNATLFKNPHSMPNEESQANHLKRVDSFMGIVGMTSSYFSPKSLAENETHACSSQSCPLFHESIRSIADVSDPMEQNDVRKGVLELLSEEDDERVPLLICMMVYFVLINQSITRDVLRSSGLLPLRFIKARRLMDFLLSKDDNGNVVKESIFDPKILKSTSIVKSSLFDDTSSSASSSSSSSPSPHPPSASAPSVLSYSSDLIADSDTQKAKELLRIAAKKTENFDEDGEYQEGEKKEERREEEGELNDPVTNSMFARRSTPNLVSAQSDPSQKEEVASYWYTFVEHLLRMLHETAADGITPKYSLHLFQVAVSVLKELLACQDSPLRFHRSHAFIFVELYDCYQLRIRQLTRILGEDEFLNAFDLATSAGYAYLDMEKLRKDIPTLLFRQPTATPAQKAFLNQYPKDITRLLGSFLVLHDLFFTHFLRAKGYVDRIRAIGQAVTPSLSLKSPVNALEYEHFFGVILPPPPTDLPTPKSRKNNPTSPRSSQLSLYPSPSEKRSSNMEIAPGSLPDLASAPTLEVLDISQLSERELEEYRGEEEERKREKERERGRENSSEFNSSHVLEQLNLDELSEGEGEREEWRESEKDSKRGEKKDALGDLLTNLEREKKKIVEEIERGEEGEGEEGESPNKKTEEKSSLFSSPSPSPSPSPSSPSIERPNSRLSRVFSSPPDSFTLALSQPSSSLCVLVADNVVYFAEKAKSETEVKATSSTPSLSTEKDTSGSMDPLGMALEEKQEPQELLEVSILAYAHLQHLEVVYDEISQCVLQYKSEIPKKISYHILYASPDECKATFERLEQLKMGHREEKLSEIFRVMDGSATLQQLVQAGIIDMSK